jgi:hypothetical protein
MLLGAAYPIHTGRSQKGTDGLSLKGMERGAVYPDFDRFSAGNVQGDAPVD